MLSQVLGRAALAKRLGQCELGFDKSCFFWREVEEISSGPDSPALCFQSRAFCPVHGFFPLAASSYCRIRFWQLSVIAVWVSCVFFAKTSTIMIPSLSKRYIILDDASPLC